MKNLETKIPYIFKLYYSHSFQHFIFEFWILNFFFWKFMPIMLYRLNKNLRNDCQFIYQRTILLTVNWINGNIWPCYLISHFNFQLQQCEYIEHQKKALILLLSLHHGTLRCDICGLDLGHVFNLMGIAQIEELIVKHL
jgi:hypothetical protein